MVAKSPERLSRSITEKLLTKITTADTAAAFARGSMIEYLRKIKNVPEEDLKPAQRAELRAITKRAQESLHLAELQIEAVNHPEKRFVLKAASAQEAKPPKRGESQQPCEDAKILEPGLYAVLDGVGGHGGGDVAAQQAATNLRRDLAKIPAQAVDDAMVTAAEKILVTALDAASKAIYLAPYNLSKGTRKSATTVAVLKIMERPGGKKTALIGNVGDSRVYVKKADGRLICLTKDHSALNALVEKGHMKADVAARLQVEFNQVLDSRNINGTVEVANDGTNQYTARDVFNMNNGISRALGYEEKSLAEVTRYEMEEGDQFMLCTDGITDLVPDSRLQDQMSSSVTAQEKADAILTDSKSGIRKGPQNKSEDDRTVIVVEQQDVLADRIANAKTDYENQLNGHSKILVPITVVAQEAFKQIVARVNDGRLDGYLRDRFILYYQKAMDSADPDLDEDTLFWNKAGANEWVTDARTAFIPDPLAASELATGSPVTPEPATGLPAPTPETAPADEVTVAKNEYRSRLLGGSMPSLPETDVKKAAFKQLVAENDPKVKAQFISYYQSESAAVLSRSSFDGLDAFKLLWHGAGATDWIFEADAPEPAAGPTSTEAIKTETSTATPEEVQTELKMWREGFLENNPTTVMRAETPAQIGGLRKFFEEIKSGRQTDKFRVWLRAMAKIGGREIAVQYANIVDVGIREEDRWMDDYEKTNYKDQADLSSNENFQPKYSLEKRWNYEMQLGAAATPEAKAALEFLNVDKILENQPMVDRLLAILKTFTGDKPPTAAGLEAMTEVIDLAKDLAMTPAKLAEIIMQQLIVFAEQAALEEKAGRSKTLGAVKSVAYLGATATTIAMSMAAAPAVAAVVSISTLAWMTTGTRITDMLISGVAHKRSESAIAKRRTADLKKSLTDGTGKAIDGLSKPGQDAMRNLAAALSIAKRTELNTTALTSSELTQQIGASLESRYANERAKLQTTHDEYLRLSADASSDPAQVESAFIEFQLAQSELDRTIEPYQRFVAGQVALMKTEEQSKAFEQPLTEPGKQSRWAKASNLFGKAFLGRGETVSEQFGSMALLMGVGVLAKENPYIRAALTSLSGARAGMLVGRLGVGAAEFIADRKDLTEAEVNAIDPTDPNADIQLKTLEIKVAIARDRLTDENFKRRNPFEYAKLKDLVDQFDQKALFIKSYAVVEQLGVTEKQLKSAKLKRFLKTATIVTASALGGAIAGYYGLEEVVKHAAEAAAAHNPASPDATNPAPAGAAPQNNSEGSISGAINPPHPATPDTTTAPDAASHPNPAATPDAAAPAPAAGSTPDATIPTPAGAAPTTPSAEVQLPTTESSIHGTPEQLSHQVRETKGLWHGLRGQGSTAEIATGLNTTKVVLHGETVSMMETGVRDADTVSPSLGTDGQVHLYDVHDGHQIADNEMDKYLYIMKEGPGGHGHASTGSAQVETHSGTHTAEVPSAQHPAVDSRQGFVDQWLHDRGFDQTSDVTAANIGGTPDYASTHDLDVATRQANAAYETSLAHASGSGDAGDHDEIAQSVGKLHGQHHGAKASHESGGGGVVKAEKVAVHPEAGKAVVLPPAAEVAPATLAKTGLDQYKPTDYSRYQTDVKHVLDTAGKSKVVGENGLIFTQKAGQILVDVPHSQGTPQVLDSAMYQAIQKEYAELVQGSPTYHGKFDSAVWITVVKNAEAARAGIKVAEK